MKRLFRFWLVFSALTALLSSFSLTALADNNPIIERSVTNAQIGYEVRVPPDWSDLNPMLVGMYNAQAGAFAIKDTLPTSLSSGFCKASASPIPPVLLLLFSSVPEGIKANEISGYNQLYFNEAKDTATKSQMAQQTGLASKVTFLGAEELRHNTPAFINGVTTTMGFTGKLLSVPFYTKEGVLTLFFFAKDDEFDALAPQVREIARNMIIFEDKRP